MRPQKNAVNQLHVQEVHRTVLTDIERESGNISNGALAEAVTFLHRDGILILENAIDPEHLDKLQMILGPEAEEIAGDPDHHFNFGEFVEYLTQSILLSC